MASACVRMHSGHGAALHRRASPRARRAACAAAKDDELRALEDELRDPSSPLEYLLPRPLRQLLLSCAGGGAAVALAVSVSQTLADPQLAAAEGSWHGTAIDAVVLALSVAGLFRESEGETRRVEERAATRSAQTARGQRSEDGRLLQVDDRWIVQRLERMAVADALPMLGRSKAEALQALVRTHRPRRVLEIGTFLGYSAIKIAQALEDDSCRVTSVERELRFVLSARRFLWQCNQGEREAGQPRVGQRVRVEWGEAAEVLARLGREGRTFDFLLLDGVPSETQLLAALAEPLLEAVAVVVAHNTVAFAGSLAPHLARVRAGDGGYSGSEAVACWWGWRGDVADALEVSVWRGPKGGGH